MTRTLIRRPSRRNLTTDPFRNVERLFNDFLRPMSLWNEWERESLDDRAWTPSVDVSETDTHYTITAELPGMSKEDVDITFENGMLTFKGEREFQETKTEGRNFHRIERAYGAFSRSFVMPTEVDTEKVEARFDNGLLTIDLPKAERAQPRKINIG